MRTTLICFAFFAIWCAIMTHAYRVRFATGCWVLIVAVFVVLPLTLLRLTNIHRPVTLYCRRLLTQAGLHDKA